MAEKCEVHEEHDSSIIENFDLDINVNSSSRMTYNFDEISIDNIS